MFSRMLLIVLAVLASTTLSRAQVTPNRYDTYLSVYGAGDVCSATNPCATLRDALARTYAGGAVFCINSGNFGGAFVVRGVTIDCSSPQGTAAFSGVGGISSDSQGHIVIDVPTSETDRSVRIRGLQLQGSSAGILINNAGSVVVEDVSIKGGRGIIDRRPTAGSKLFIRNTVIRDSNGPAVVAAAAATSGTVLDNVSLLNGSYGLASATGNNVVIKNSVISGHAVAAVEADAGAQVNVRDSVVSHSNYGIQAAGTIRLFNTDVEFNNRAFYGTAVSLGSNRVTGNSTVGDGLTPLGGASADVIQ